MGNPVVHWELLLKEPAKVAAFHAKAFGISSASQRS